MNKEQKKQASTEAGNVLYTLLGNVDLVYVKLSKGA